MIVWNNHIYFTGSQFSQDVIRQIGPQINQCQCVRDLAVYLQNRNVLNLKEYYELTQSGTSGSTSMLTVLLKASQEPCRREDLISKLFLALLDMFCDTENSWCHHTAFHVVRERGRCTYVSLNIFYRAKYSGFGQTHMIIMHKCTATIACTHIVLDSIPCIICTHLLYVWAEHDTWYFICQLLLSTFSCWKTGVMFQHEPKYW